MPWFVALVCWLKGRRTLPAPSALAAAPLLPTDRLPEWVEPRPPVDRLLDWVTMHRALERYGGTTRPVLLSAATRREAAGGPRPPARPRRQVE